MLAQVTSAGGEGLDAAVRSDRPAGAVLRLTLNRPSQRNALSGDLAVGLRAALHDAARDHEARVAIITGAGPAFCAGADLGSLRAGADLEALRERLAEYYRTFLDLLEFPLPTVAAVNGAAVGAGLNLALCCDLRIAASGAVLSAPFVRLGIHPGGGCDWLLPRLGGAGLAREMLLLGERVPAERAYASGLVNQVVPPERLEEAALNVAERLAALPGRLLREIRQTLRASEQGASFEQVLEQETDIQARSLLSENATEGWNAFLERRPPRFSQDR